MSRKRKALSHAEIWDDSALIESWDAALDEYKEYHSIHVSGRSLSDFLEQAPSEGELELQSGQEPSLNKFAAKDEHIMHGQNDDQEEGELQEEHFLEATDQGSVPSSDRDPSANAAPQLGKDSVPGQSPLDAVQDLGLKNVIMAWYWAGYYTGLHEGQKTHHQP